MTDIQTLVTENLDVWTSAVQTKSGVGRGNGKKLNLYGIKKLRELILELAVRGKLVPQDENDEPASVLLEKIAAEKERLIKEKKIKKPKKLPEIDEDEKLFELPVGWEWAQLGNITEINPRNSADDKLDVAFVPMPKVTTCYKGEHGQENRMWGDIKKGYTHFANGDIAIAKITPCFENSKAAVFSGLKNNIGAGTTELHVARPFGETVNRFYILLYLKAPQFLLVGRTKMTGSAGQKRVPKDFFSNNPLPLPPLSEQHQIVAKVDELMALCDQLEQHTEESITAHKTLVKTLLATLTNSRNAEELTQNWNRISDHFDTLFTTETSIDQLKQTILQLAVMGKLVPQDPNDEPASVLLEKIAIEKARLIKEKKIKKPKKLPEIGEGEKPFELPQGWEWVRLGKLFNSIISGGTPSKRNSSYWGGNIPWASVKDLGTEKFISNTEDYITESGLKNGSKLADKGDVLICTRMGLGKIAVTTNSIAFNQDLKGVKLTSSLDVDFFINSYATIKIKGTGTTVAGIKQEQLLAYIIGFPPITEQHRIVAKVDELMSLCDKLKLNFSESQTTQLNLTNAIIEKAVS